MMDLESQHGRTKRELLQFAQSFLTPEQVAEMNFILQAEDDPSDALIYELLRTWDIPQITEMYLKSPTVLGDLYRPMQSSEPQPELIERKFDDFADF